jgi:hypothetical protein
LNFRPWVLLVSVNYSLSLNIWNRNFLNRISKYYLKHLWQVWESLWVQPAPSLQYPVFVWLLSLNYFFRAINLNQIEFLLQVKSHLGLADFIHSWTHPMPKIIFQSLVSTMKSKDISSICVTFFFFLIYSFCVWASADYLVFILFWSSNPCLPVSCWIILLFL